MRDVYINLVLLILNCVVKCPAMSDDELEDFKEFLEKTSALDQALKDGFNSEEEEDDGDYVSDHAWEESGKFEGDLILSDRQRKIIVADVAEGLSRNGLNDITKRWPNNEVTYYIQKEHFSGSQMQAIQDGIEDIGRSSCIKFKPYRKGDRDAVVIQGSRRGCFSQVGYQGGYQVLNLSGRHPVGRGCFRHGTVVHELLHTLGFYHMQSSPDRDDHIDVVWENIIEAAKHNFRKYNSFAVSDFGVGYDYDSVLHYSKRAFSTNGRDTLVPKKSDAEIGQRVGLSDKDTQKLNKMYCDSDSNSFDQDEKPTTKAPRKKQSAKNKPFQGHGIGYHQGNAVAIKVNPEAKTYKLIELPPYRMFHYFSKTPETLSPSTYLEGFREEIKPTAKSKNEKNNLSNSYENENIFDDEISQSYENFNKQSDVYKDDYNLQNQENNFNNDKELKNMSVTEKNYEIKLSDEKDGKEKPKTEQKDAESEEALYDALERLSKIIKSHVYPSHGFDFNQYRDGTNAPYTNDNKNDTFPTKQEKIDINDENYFSRVPSGLKKSQDLNKPSYKYTSTDNKYGDKSLFDENPETDSIESPKNSEADSPIKRDEIIYDYNYDDPRYEEERSNEDLDDNHKAQYKTFEKPRPFNSYNSEIKPYDLPSIKTYK